MLRPSPRVFCAAICLVAGIGLGIACVVTQGPLPGDIAITKTLQSLLGPEPSWAAPVTRTAKHPFVWVVLTLGCGLAYIRGGWRAPAATLIAFAVVKGLDAVMRASFHAPKPIADWVAIASPSDSSGFPSTFGLVYAAIFGGVLFAYAKPDWKSTIIAVAAAIMIVIGSVSRIVLGGHWTSQLAASILIAFAIVMITYRLLETKRETTAPPEND
ncbi:PAP2 superfamily protein [Neorhodopirellula lusitana]|uniref:PAP2 superfamily protein n=1 Tax=Neorhodopirellula lusitana TaxID=445327 RepID=A0ABY1QG22_9BACT|nr:phosphatase PAP2 family protein [Neorhodopirellula lusitana]SMP69660.1 PAP2 superfamily protein [Neorhodopirellula lusitana]